MRTPVALVVGFGVAAGLWAACTGGPSSPTAPSSLVSTACPPSGPFPSLQAGDLVGFVSYSPPRSSALVEGGSYCIGYIKQVRSDSFVAQAVVLVRDDGKSKVLGCGFDEQGSPGGPGGSAHYGDAGVLISFGSGHVLNAAIIAASYSSRSGRCPLVNDTGQEPLWNVAQQRTDIPLNWQTPSTYGFKLPTGNASIVCVFDSVTCAVAGQFHTGVDYAANNVIAQAAGPGRVVRLQRNGDGCVGGNGPGRGCLDHGLGNAIVIEHLLPSGQIVYSLYAHLARVQDGLTLGSCLKPGDLLGFIGGTGYGLPDYWSAHLHFEIKNGNTLENPSGGGTYWGVHAKFSSRLRVSESL